ncbi:MAG: hypothetical protein RL494_639 [Bacteroidota bacterium]|jgi:protein TonB
MRSKYFCLLVFFILTLCVYSQTVKTEPIDSIYETPEIVAYYPNLVQFISKNFQCPPKAIENNLKGYSKIEFIVHKNGTLSNFIVIEGFEGCKECDEEAIRVLKKTKKWIPARENGEKVSSRQTQIIKFSIM